MSERLRPIPTPPSQLWRQVRLQYLPVLVFVLGLVSAALIWNHWVAPPTLVGEAEAIRTELRSSQAGRLVGLEVDLLQPVTAGQTIGRVIVNEPSILEASLALVRAEIDMMLATKDPVVGQQRAALDLDRLHLDWMRSRADLAMLRGELHQAEITFTRAEQLHRSKMISDEEFDLARNARNTLADRVKANTELVTRLEPRLRDLTAAYAAAPTAAEGLDSAIKHKEQELKLLEAQLRPLPLIAPIDGVVTAMWRRNGESVGSAEPILQITATQTERIVGFLRAPVTIDLKPGMSVEVRTRTAQRRIGEATIARVGQQFEPISPTLLAAMRLPVSTIPTEMGLQVHVTPPAGLNLRPGEHVDLIIHP